MVKLASARESRMYGPRLGRGRGENLNAALYLLATVVLAGGFVSQFSQEPKSGLVLLLIATGFIIIVNVHDLIAHLVIIDFRLRLLELDLQLALVEVAVPVVQAIGSLLFFLGILILFLQEEKAYGFFKLEKHALRLLVAGPMLWVLGSTHNSCQIYERADGHVQILQESVHVPFLMGSLLFLVGAILNYLGQKGKSLINHHGLDLLGEDWIWFGIFGSILFFTGGMNNVVKVFKMQQMEGGVRLEKLRGGAQERLEEERGGDDHFPLMLNHDHIIKIPTTDDKPPHTPSAKPRVAALTPTPYKDVLLGHPV
ncbi:uncharacterized protein LOC124910649 [Impatiens glandulifera]|uniref:uncharacterized protein LOC124910649 n=1 Tax=Impatiens glandulifera TaxID=253017 RepID=UPI001FB19315|nr:uncharacterized protein LOC124910649 [Impatiens glandulifera]